MALSREEARERGDRFYNTGKPCRSGHDSKRYTSTGMCVQCLKDHAAEQSKVNADRRKIHNSRKLKDPRLFVTLIQPEAHVVLAQVCDIFKYAPRQVIDQVQAFMGAMYIAVTPSSSAAQPMGEAMTKADIKCFMQFDDAGKVCTNIRDFDVLDDSRDDDYQSCLFMNGRWYPILGIQAVLRDSQAVVNPIDPLPHWLPATMKGIIK